MDEKHVVPETGVAHHDPHAPVYADADWRSKESFATRNGLNMRSFQRRPDVGPNVELDKSMKTRHLHMIAIGGSIGAGFFVGSGSALFRGVRQPSCSLMSPCLPSIRALASSSSIS